MRNELKHIEEIENYLLGNLSDADKKLFEQKLQMNPSLQTEVELQKSISEKIAIKGFAADINHFHQQFIAAESANSGFFTSKWFLNTFLAIFVTGISALSIYYFAQDRNSELINKNSNNKETALVVNEPANKISNNAVEDSLRSQRKVVSTYSSATMIPSGPLYKKSGNSIPKDNIDRVDDFNSIPGDAGDNILKKVQVPFEEITMNAQEGKEFYTKKSGSRIIFPAGILQHQDGSKVEGDVVLRYREFRNPAEMAFSGIPMEHEQNGEKFQMNSAGMIEIRCVQNGEELKIGKNNYFTIDFKVTDNLDDCYFWSLNDDTQKWTCKDTLRYGNPNPEIKEDYPYSMLIGKVFDAYSGDTLYYPEIKLTRIGDLGKTETNLFYNDTGFIMPKVMPGQYLATISVKGYHTFQFNSIYLSQGQMTKMEIHLKPRKKYHHFIDDLIIGLFNKNSYNRKIKNTNSRASSCFDKDIPDYLKGEYSMSSKVRDDIYANFTSKKASNKLTKNSGGNQKPSFIISNSNAERQENIQKENAFQKTVYGLQMEGFGVYNCDQIQRMNEPVKVRPSFGNSEIPDNNTYKQMIVIDKNMNSVFNFYGNEFTINKSGKNCLLVYHNGKIYGLQEEEFSKLGISKNGNYNFTLREITAEINSTEDLKKFLEL